MFTLEQIAKALIAEGVEGVTPEIDDFQWDWDDVNAPDGTARVTIWLKREDTDD